MAQSQAAAFPAQKDLLDRVFRLTENQTTIRRELLGGLTTFMAMAYVVVQYRCRGLEFCAFFSHGQFGAQNTPDTVAPANIMLHSVALPRESQAGAARNQAQVQSTK